MQSDNTILDVIGPVPYKAMILFEVPSRPIEHPEGRAAFRRERSFCFMYESFSIHLEGMTRVGPFGSVIYRRPPHSGRQCARVARVTRAPRSRPAPPINGGAVTIADPVSVVGHA
ncbi:hypothetical protein EVAR_74880_1 [Eumeta japonica]|uniref:Uncharacterized protein n=1 Tax=Eumeta variegata TaxID=151549 RepID=A0A4C1SQH1_EUMVA|nr:hypothetical protein EVAR_74880_1 [Eumeta japonica]